MRRGWISFVEKETRMGDDNDNYVDMASRTFVRSIARRFGGDA